MQLKECNEWGSILMKFINEVVNVNGGITIILFVVTKLVYVEFIWWKYMKLIRIILTKLEWNGD